MKKEVFEKLRNSRFLNNATEIGIFEDNLEKLAETFTETDIIELCSVFDDKTNDSEAMFGAIHLLETLSSELAFENTIKGVVLMRKEAKEWSNIIIYRCLNDDYSVSMIKSVYKNLDKDIIDSFEKQLLDIKFHDKEKFGHAIDEILM